MLVRYILDSAAEPSGRDEVTENFSPTPIVTLPFEMDTLSGAFLTLTVHFAVLPLPVFAVMTAEPLFLPTISPLDETVTTLLLSDVHVSVLSVAFEGLIAGIRSAISPLPIEKAVLLREIPVTSTGGLVTVTEHDAVLPLLVFAVMVAFPAATAVTFPSETVATLLLLVVHVTVLSVESVGYTVAVRAALRPFWIDKDVLLRLIFVGLITTVTVQVAVFPLKVFAVMIAFPVDCAVIVPFDTVAMLLSELVHVTVLSVATAGEMVAVMVDLPPLLIVTAVLLSVIPVGSTIAFCFTSNVSGSRV